MHITKDECRILAHALDDAKYDIADGLVGEEKEMLLAALTDLEARLMQNRIDRRRMDRTSQNDWCDMLRRYTRESIRRNEGELPFL